MTNTMNQELSKGETLQGCRVSPWSRGFTLIELLVVIAILGIISVGILTAINVTGSFDKARIAKAKTFDKSLESALSVSQVGKWSFEESLSPFKDTSGNGNDGICSTPSCPTSQGESNCKLGLKRCLNFDGINDYINLPRVDIFDFGTGDFTISAWINALSGDSRRFIYGKTIFFPNTFKLSFYITNVLNLQFDGNPISGLGPSKVVGDGKWHHVAATRRSGIVKLYVDGTQDGPEGGSRSNVVDLSSNGAERIGQSGINSIPYYFNGMMDEVAMYNEALGASQIHHLYAQGLAKHPLAKR